MVCSIIQHSEYGYLSMEPAPKDQADWNHITGRCQCWLSWCRSFGYLGKSAFHAGSHLRVGFPGCISDLLLIAPPHLLLLVPHQLCLPLHWWIHWPLQLTVDQDWLIEPRACSVRKCAPTEWHLHICMNNLNHKKIHTHTHTHTHTHNSVCYHTLTSPN